MSRSWPYVALVLLVTLSSACSQSTRMGGDQDADGDTSLPDGGPWPDADLWWPDGELPDVGPVCPDAGSARTVRECDVLLQLGCRPGEACYSWIESHPDPCIREVYHAGCLPEGRGEQGDPCDDWCARGLECFVTGEGTQCLNVCDVLGGEPRCPAGLICRPSDMPGIGACH